MTGRGRIAIVALILLLVYLVATNLRETDQRRQADSQRDKAIASLQKTNDGIVEKLTEIFAKAAAAEDAARAAGQVPTTTVEKIAESLKGYVDPKLIEEAIQKARGASGQPGPPGPPGPAGAGATTTSTAPATTTSTTRPPATTTTTTRSSTTTTTRPCATEVLNLIKIGC